MATKKKSASRKAVKKAKPAAAKKKTSSQAVATYDKDKVFAGAHYRGMQVGRSHKWYYDKGEWHETKITPDLWEISYAVTKRRAGKAPKGSGVPVGTGYHWYILAHQNVVKLNADDYTTSLTGIKYKLAHKRANSEKWSGSVKAQKKKMINLFQEMIDQLKKEPVEIEFEYDEMKYKGEAVPVPETYHDGMHYELDITLNDEEIGIIKRMKNNWKIDGAEDQKFVDEIGREIEEWYH